LHFEENRGESLDRSFVNCVLQNVQEAEKISWFVQLLCCSTWWSCGMEKILKYTEPNAWKIYILTCARVRRIKRSNINLVVEIFIAGESRQTAHVWWVFEHEISWEHFCWKLPRLFQFISKLRSIQFGLKTYQESRINYFNFSTRSGINYSKYKVKCFGFCDAPERWIFWAHSITTATAKIKNQKSQALRTRKITQVVMFDIKIESLLSVCVIVWCEEWIGDLCDGRDENRKLLCHKAARNLLHLLS
jgi:hypothetical protein